MDRRNIIIIISIISLGTLLGGAYWYFTNKAAPGALRGLFPGESGLRPGGTTLPTEGEEQPEDIPIFTPGSTPPRLYELHKVPVAGVGFAENKDKAGVVLAVTTRYAEKGLGHIYETPLSTYTESRIVNETRPRLGEALWGNNGKSVVVRFTDDTQGGAIKTRIINIEDSGLSFSRDSSFLKTEEVFLPDFIPFMSMSEDGADKVFYLENGSASSAGSVSTVKGTAVSKIFTSSFREWLPQFPNQKLITLTTRPSATVPGYLFFLDPKTTTVTKILENIKGLTTLTGHDGKFVLYSETKYSTPELSLYDVTAKKTYSLYIKTLPEKCAWGNKDTSLVYCAVPQSISVGTYPDEWYQGLTSFSDSVWQIDTKTLVASLLFETKPLGAPALDITSMAISSDDTYLLFINKKTGTPWVYSMLEPKPVETPPSPASEQQNIAPSSLPEETTASSSVVTPDMQKLK